MLLFHFLAIDVISRVWNSSITPVFSSNVNLPLTYRAIRTSREQWLILRSRRAIYYSIVYTICCTSGKYKCKQKDDLANILTGVLSNKRLHGKIIRDMHNLDINYGKNIKLCKHYVLRNVLQKQVQWTAFVIQNIVKYRDNVLFFARSREHVRVMATG